MSITRPLDSASLLKVRPRRVLCACLAIGASVLLAQCGIVKPEAPRFTTWLNVPFEPQDILMADLADDEELLAESEGGLSLYMEGDSLRVAIEQDLIASLDDQVAVFELGTFAIDTGDPDTYAYELIELYPAAGEAPSGIVAVPPFEFVLEPEAKDVQRVESAHVVSGALRAVVRNEMQVPISGPEPPRTVRCEIRDPQTGDLLDTLVFPDEIAPQASDTATVDLAGVQIPDSLAVRILGGSAGHPGVDDLDPHRLFQVVVDYVDLRVDEATAEIGEQSVSELRAAAIDDDLRILEASIASGSLEIALTNEMPLPVHAELRFAELWLPGGEPVGVARDLAAGESAAVPIDLAGARIAAPGEEPLDSLRYSVLIESPGSGGETVTVSAGDYLSGAIGGAEIAMSECTGIFPERTFDLDPVSEELDLPDELSGVHFSQAALIIEVLNETEFSGVLDIELESHFADGDFLSLLHSAFIAAGGPGGVQRTQIVVDQNNSNLPEMLSGAPDRLEMRGRVTAGGGEIVTARPGQGADIRWSVEAPLTVSVAPTQIRKDPFRLDVDADTLDDLRRRLESARLVADVENALPLGMELRFLVGADSATVHTDPLRVAGPFTVAAAPTSAAGIVTAPIHSLQEIALDHDDVLAFTDAANYLAIAVDLPGTDGEEITLLPANFVTVRGILKAEIRSTED